MVNGVETRQWDIVNVQEFIDEYRREMDNLSKTTPYWDNDDYVYVTNSLLSKIDAASAEPDGLEKIKEIISQYRMKIAVA
jgi:hypothetical protein